MSSPIFWKISAFCIAFGCLAAAGPTSICEESGDRIADTESCTRYHICRTNDNGSFTTDIAICTATNVFDMVDRTCIEVGTGYLQDPDSCTSFYGCHKANENSEGYVRRHFNCPGELRFHPVEKYCNHKTMVPDRLCSKETSSQQIIGHETTTTTTTTQPPPVTEAPTEAPTTDATTTTTTTAIPVRDASDNTSASETLPKKTSSITDIERITQVIKGQLLNRRPIINNQVIPASRE